MLKLNILFHLKRIGFVMDWKKVVKAALFPIAISVLLFLVNYTSFFSLNSFGFASIALLLTFIMIVNFVYVGYQSVNAYKFDLKGAALVGAVVGFATTMVGVIIALVLVASGRLPAMPFGAGIGEQVIDDRVRNIMLVLIPILGVVGAVFNAAFVGLLSMLGGVIAQRKKKPKQG
jgi:hypothetical protein